MARRRSCTARGWRDSGGALGWGWSTPGMLLGVAWICVPDARRVTLRPVRMPRVNLARVRAVADRQDQEEREQCDDGESDDDLHGCSSVAGGATCVVWPGRRPCAIESRGPSFRHGAVPDSGSAWVKSLNLRQAREIRRSAGPAPCVRPPRSRNSSDGRRYGGFAEMASRLSPRVTFGVRFQQDGRPGVRLAQARPCPLGRFRPSSRLRHRSNGARVATPEPARRDRRMRQ